MCLSFSRIQTYTVVDGALLTVLFVFFRRHSLIVSVLC